MTTKYLLFNLQYVRLSVDYSFCKLPLIIVVILADNIALKQNVLTYTNYEVALFYKTTYSLEKKTLK